MQWTLKIYNNWIFENEPLRNYSSSPKTIVAFMKNLNSTDNFRYQFNNVDLCLQYIYYIKSSIIDIQNDG